MVKSKLLAIAVLCAGVLSFQSCTLTHTAVVTNNSVGSKTGKIKSGSNDMDQGVTYSGAMKAGRITRAGIAEYKMKNVVIFLREEMVVTGE